MLMTNAGHHYAFVRSVAIYCNRVVCVEAGKVTHNNGLAMCAACVDQNEVSFLLCSNDCVAPQ